jgi:hypothetical protein
MTALSIQPPFPTITDTDGQPLENGYIWIGTANLPAQTTPISVYWDAALTQPAAQPIRTQGGYPVNSGTPARLYVNSDYSILVQNSRGTTVYSAPQATERYSDPVISGVDSSEVTFLQAGSGAVVRTAQSKMRDVVSVKDFGAVGDGVADDTVAIQNAMDASSGVHLPAGTYKISSSLQMNDNNFVFGEGRGSEILATHNGAVFKGKNVTLASGTNVRRFSGGGSNLKIYGPGTAAGASIGLDMRGCTMFKWSNVLIQNINTGVIHGDGYSSYYNEYVGVDISTVVYGYYNDALGNENMVVGGRVNDCTYGTRDADNSHNKYVGVAIEVFSNIGHLVSAPAAQQIQFLCSRLENVPTSGIGISIDATAQDTQVLSPQFIGLTTDIADSGIRSNIVASEYWKFSGGARVRTHLRVTQSIDFPSIPAQTSSDQLVTISGALATDSVFVTPDATIGADLIANAIPASGGVYVRLANISGGAIDPPALTFTIDIWRH